VINDPTLLLNVIIGVESIVYAYDPETTAIFAMEESRVSKTLKAHMQKSN